MMKTMAIALVTLAFSAAANAACTPLGGFWHVSMVEHHKAAQFAPAETVPWSCSIRLANNGRILGGQCDNGLIFRFGGQIRRSETTCAVYRSTCVGFQIDGETFRRAGCSRGAAVADHGVIIMQTTETQPLVPGETIYEWTMVKTQR